MDAPDKPDAGPPAGDEQLAELREEIWWAGVATCQVRIGTVALTLLLLAVTVAGSVISRGYPTLLTPTADFVVQFLTGLPCVAGLGMLFAGLYGAAQRQRFYQRLRALSAVETATVLAPLQAKAWGDSRKLVRDLARDLGLPPDLRPPTELTPAAADARGDEPAPAP